LNFAFTIDFSKPISNERLKSESVGNCKAAIQIMKKFGNSDANLKVGFDRVEKRQEPYTAG